MTFATLHRHKEKTPQGKALMDAYAARLKDIKAAFSMRCAAKHREYAVCMLYMYVDISFMYFHGMFWYFRFTVFHSISVSLTFANLGLLEQLSSEESKCRLLAKPFSSFLYTFECCSCVFI